MHHHPPPCTTVHHTAPPCTILHHLAPPPPARRTPAACPPHAPLQVVSADGGVRFLHQARGEAWSCRNSKGGGLEYVDLVTGDSMYEPPEGTDLPWEAAAAAAEAAEAAAAAA